MPPDDDPLAAVRHATRTRTRDRDRAAASDLAWRQAIRAALTAGRLPSEIAEAAGISRERVYQIRDNRRR